MLHKFMSETEGYEYFWLSHTHVISLFPCKNSIPALIAVGGEMGCRIKFSMLQIYGFSNMNFDLRM